MIFSQIILVLARVKKNLRLQNSPNVQCMFLIVCGIQAQWKQYLSSIQTQWKQYEWYTGPVETLFEWYTGPVETLFEWYTGPVETIFEWYNYRLI